MGDGTKYILSFTAFAIAWLVSYSGEYSISFSLIGVAIFLKP